MKALTTLIVDDDMPTVELIRSSVDWQSLGIGRVLTAYNIAQAKKHLLEQGTDIVISDIEMPRGSGLELLEWIREQRMDVAFLLLTCHERFDYAVNAVKLRASEFLMKPFDVGTMEAALHRIVDEKFSGEVPEEAPGRDEEENTGDMDRSQREPALELGKLEEMLERRDKRAFLNEIRSCISAAGGAERKKIQHEILQAVYLFLGKRELSAAWLYTNENMIALSERAEASATDLLRWCNYLLEYTLSYEEEMRRKASLSERVDEYIREHYGEDIGRNEIAAEFYMNPEYLAKVYKKQTGRNLADAISIYRVEQAKRLLDQGEMVGDTAIAVGFNNQAYFSTIFKKYTGKTPVQYRNKN